MALFHVFDLVDNRRTGVPMAGVQVRAKFDDTDTIAPIYADQSGTAFDPANYCVTDADGMFSFYIDSGEYTLEFLVGDVVLKTIPDFRPAEIGPSGPANSTFNATAEIENADVSNVSAILAEVGKAGTFTTRDYVDFTAQVAADPGKINYIRSVSDPTKVWVRTSILSDAASQTGASSGLTVDAELAAKATLTGVARTATNLGTFSGSTIPDNQAIKGAIQALETAVENTTGNAATKVNATAVGVAATDSNMGTTPGSILSDNGTAKQWFQESEASLELGGRFLQAGGGAVTRTGQDKARERVSVKDFGAVGNGTADDTAAIQAAITYIGSVGGGDVFFPRGRYKVTATISWSNNHITLVGEGGGVDGNVAFVGGMTAALASIASLIVWAGAAGGTVIQIAPTPDNGTQPPVAGGGMRDIAVDGASIANDGIDLRSLRYAKFTNVSSMRCNSVNWKIGVTTNNLAGGNKSIAFCEFRNCTGSNSTIGGNTAKTMVLYGHITDGNVAINLFDNCGFYNASGSGSHIEVENSDSNTFVHCRWSGSLTLHATDTGSFSQGGDAVARHNVFLNNQGHIIAKAKIATPHTQGTNGYDSYGNVAYGYSRENGIAYPTIEAYADFQYHATGLGLTNSQGGFKFGHAPCITLMAKSGNQSIAAGSNVVVDWDAVSFDWLACGNATTNRITAPNGCKWVRFMYGSEWANDSTAGRFISIRRNGTDFISKSQMAGYINSQDVVTTQWFPITPGDYYEMVVNQNTGGALNLLGGTSTFMQAEWC